MSHDTPASRLRLFENKFEISYIGWGNRIYLKEVRLTQPFQIRPPFSRLAREKATSNYYANLCISFLLNSLNAEYQEAVYMLSIQNPAKVGVDSANNGACLSTSKNLCPYTGKRIGRLNRGAEDGFKTLPHPEVLGSCGIS
jgi:hypothetical protein